MIRNSPQHIAYYEMLKKEEFSKFLNHLRVGVWVLILFWILSFIFEPQNPNYLGQQQTAYLSFGFWVFCLLYCYWNMPKTKIYDKEKGYIKKLLNKLIS